jgi:DNA-binding NarL/FixJ family response regulator
MLPGIHGVRLLAAAYAEVLLRKRGELPKLKPKKRHGKRGKPWSDDEHDTALSMRMRGKSNEQIAQALGRSVHAVKNQIGYETKRAA